MTDNPAQTTTQGGGCGLAKILTQALIVAVVGVTFAFTANQLSPNGLKLSRDYSVAKNPDAKAAPVEEKKGDLAAQLQQKGLHLILRADVEKLFHDPRVQQGAILFVDARDEDAFQIGHIPGACEFFPYYPEKYMETVMPLCQAADQIIVYCKGGECEDSQEAAVFLRDAGIPAAKLFVYGGGIGDWVLAGLPLESGERNSGHIREGSK